MADVKLPNMQHPVVPGPGGQRTYQSAAVNADMLLAQARDEADEGDYSVMQSLPLNIYSMSRGENRGQGGGTFCADDILVDMNGKGD